MSDVVRCRECRHWDASQPESDDGGLNTCMRVSNVARYREDARSFMATTTAEGEQGEVPSELRTCPEFGCVLGERK